MLFKEFTEHLHIINVVLTTAAHYLSSASMQWYC